MKIEEIEIGQFLKILGKPGVVVDVLHGKEQNAIWFKSANGISRGNDTELILFAPIAHAIVRMNEDEIVKDIDGYIAVFLARIEKLKEYKKEITCVSS